jgi:hypothetical protein
LIPFAAGLRAKSSRTPVQPSSSASRSATTDGAGRYTVTSPRPGTYSVTFALPGFNTVKREGVELTSDFTANNNGVPVSVTLRLPRDQRVGIKADTGIFAQDKWSITCVTLNLGLRYDWFIGETQEEDLLAGRGVAWDVFGNGRTAMKASAARYVNGEAERRNRVVARRWLLTLGIAVCHPTTVPRTDVGARRPPPS